VNGLQDENTDRRYASAERIEARLGKPWDEITRLADAAAGGHKLIALTASRLGYPLYRQFGFEHIFDFYFFCPP
jgi:hypothetical protein